MTTDEQTLGQFSGLHFLDLNPKFFFLYLNSFDLNNIMKFDLDISTNGNLMKMTRAFKYQSNYSFLLKVLLCN